MIAETESVDDFIKFAQRVRSRLFSFYAVYTLDSTIL